MFEAAEESEAVVPVLASLFIPLPSLAILRVLLLLPPVTATPRRKHLGGCDV